MSVKRRLNDKLKYSHNREYYTATKVNILLSSLYKMFSERNLTQKSTYCFIIFYINFKIVKLIIMQRCVCRNSKRVLSRKGHKDSFWGIVIYY